jgi:hypothetical protein
VIADVTDAGRHDQPQVRPARPLPGKGTPSGAGGSAQTVADLRPAAKTAEPGADKRATIDKVCGYTTPMANISAGDKASHGHCGTDSRAAAEHTCRVRGVATLRDRRAEPLK